MNDDLIIDASNAYEKSQEYHRKGNFIEADAWLSASAMLGDEKAILEYASRYLDSKNTSENNTVIKGLLEVVSTSIDVYNRSASHILLAELALRMDDTRLAKMAALDHLLLAQAYGDERAISLVLPLLKELSLNDNKIAYISLGFVKRELSEVKENSILHEELLSLEKYLEKFFKNNYKFKK